MGRKLKYGELTKVLRIRIPESKYEDFRKMALEYLEKYILKIEVIINKEPSESNCFNCNNSKIKSYGSDCDNGIYAFRTCKLTGDIVGGCSLRIEHDDGRIEKATAEEYRGNKGCNKWEVQNQKN